MHIVAIYGLYCNKTCTYHNKTKPWQYARPITTKVKMVAILRFIATKCGCSNKNLVHIFFLVTLKLIKRQGRHKNWPVWLTYWIDKLLVLVLLSRTRLLWRSSAGRGGGWHAGTYIWRVHMPGAQRQHRLCQGIPILLSLQIQYTYIERWVINQIPMVGME
jgi:hypothetical protein